MSETPIERQTGIGKHAGAPIGSVETNSHSPRSRTLQAGGEFLKALGDDLAAVASQLRLWMTKTRRRTRRTPLSASGGISQGSTIGRLLWRLSVILLTFGTICAGALCAVTLWVLVGSPLEPRRSEADNLGSQFEARKGEALGGAGPLKVTEAARRTLGANPGRRAGPKPTRQTRRLQPGHLPAASQRRQRRRERRPVVPRGKLQSANRRSAPALRSRLVVAQRRRTEEGDQGETG